MYTQRVVFFYLFVRNVKTKLQFSFFPTECGAKFSSCSLRVEFIRLYLRMTFCWTKNRVSGFVVNERLLKFKFFHGFDSIIHNQLSDFKIEKILFYRNRDGF